MAKYCWRTGRSTRGALSTLCCLALVSACAGQNLEAGRPAPSVIEGIVSYGGEPLAGAVVAVYRSLEDFRRGEAFSRSGPTGRDGAFSLDLPAGRYYIAAVANRQGGEGERLVNFHGSNPVSVTAGARLPIGLSLAPRSPPPRYVDTGPGSGGVSGTVVHGGEPLAGAVAFLYLGEQTDFKGTAYAVAPPTDEEGTFSLSGLVESSYYVVVRKRSGNRTAGPLAPGDHYGFYPHNPLRVEDGKMAEIVVETIVRPEDPRTVNRGERLSRTRIEGRITDTAGRPQAGLYAFVYPDRIMSHTKPLAISSPSGRDGVFTLNLERGGKFFLGAREHYGTNPRPGELYGKYTETPDHSIAVDEGEVRRGVTIVVDRILE